MRSTEILSKQHFFYGRIERNVLCKRRVKRERPGKGEWGNLGNENYSNELNDHFGF